MNVTAIEALQDKARRSLAAAEHHLTVGDYDFAASRAYYALFYLAEALLLVKGQSFSKHSAVISAVYEHFVKPGLLPKSYHQLLHEAFDERQEADYLAGIQIGADEAATLVKRARDFLTQAEALLKNP